MSKRRLHWLWRGILAILAVIFCEQLVSATPPLAAAMRRTTDLIRSRFPLYSREGVLVAACVVGVIPDVLVALVVFGTLTRHFGPRAAGEDETHCRKCDHILRGITEPRCPTCGERM